MFFLILQHRRESLAKLQERWPTPLASTIRYASQAHTALTTALTLAGIAAPLEVQWLPPVLCNVSVDTFPEDLGLPFVDLIQLNQSRTRIRLPWKTFLKIQKNILTPTKMACVKSKLRRMPTV